MPDRFNTLFKPILLFVVFSFLWLLISDRLVDRVPVDDSYKTVIATAKGTIFVLISAGLFYVSMNRQLTRREKLVETHVHEQAALLKQLQLANDQINESYEATIQGWAKALEIREKETSGHSARVVQMMEHMMHLLECADEECRIARHGALLHDIGKVGIPDNILLKPGSLTEDERAVINTHTLLAEKWLSGSPSHELQAAMCIPAYHHERIDGSGYPYKKKGEEIPFLARVFAIIDVADAMGSTRPYRTAIPISDVYQHLWENAGILYDQDFVHLFIKNDVMRCNDELRNFYDLKNSRIH